jgi:hypothetical protein
MRQRQRLGKGSREFLLVSRTGISATGQPLVHKADEMESGHEPESEKENRDKQEKKVNTGEKGNQYCAQAEGNAGLLPDKPTSKDIVESLGTFQDSVCSALEHLFPKESEEGKQCKCKHKEDADCREDKVGSDTLH